MEEQKTHYELTLKGKIILVSAALLLIIIIIYLIVPKGKDIESISLDIVDKNQGSIIYDPVNGNKVRLEIAKKIQLSTTIYPENHKKQEIEYIVEDENIAYINSKNMLVGKKAGNTRVYARVKDDKNIKSNYIDVEIIY